MPRYDVTLTLRMTVDAESDEMAEGIIDDVMLAAQQTPDVDVNKDATELRISIQPRPTKAELSTTV